MKKNIVYLVMGALFVLIIGAAIPAEKQYWQDNLAKPEQAWVEKFGYSDDSTLAYNIRRMFGFIQAQQNQISELQKWVLAQPQWTFVDVNEPKYKLEMKGMKYPILEMGNWSDPNR